MVLWIDEIEKGLAGIQSSGHSDGGVTARVFGTLLTWLQEKTAPVFVVATANRIEQLPPELLRKGRFDEIFFIDLPAAAERREILRIHVRKRGRDPAAYDLERLAGLAEGFSGAELEQAVISALYDAFAEGKELERGAPRGRGARSRCRSPSPCARRSSGCATGRGPARAPPPSRRPSPSPPPRPASEPCPASAASSTSSDPGRTGRGGRSGRRDRGALRGRGAPRRGPGGPERVGGGARPLRPGPRAGDRARAAGRGGAALHPLHALRDGPRVFATECSDCGARLDTEAQRELNERLWAERQAEAARDAARRGSGRRSPRPPRRSPRRPGAPGRRSSRARWDGASASASTRRGSAEGGAFRPAAAAGACSAGSSGSFAADGRSRRTP